MSFKLEELMNKLANLYQQKELAQQTFHQVIGAISIVEELVKKIKEDLSNKPVENNDGGKVDSENAYEEGSAP